MIDVLTLTQFTNNKVAQFHYHDAIWFVLLRTVPFQMYILFVTAHPLGLTKINGDWVLQKNHLAVGDGAPLFLQSLLTSSLYGAFPCLEIRKSILLRNALLYNHWILTEPLETEPYTRPIIYASHHIRLQLGIQINLQPRKTGKISCLELSLPDVWCKFFPLIPLIAQL